MSPMARTERPPIRATPPQRDQSAPRPYADVPTDTLLATVTKLSEQVRELQAKQRPLRVQRGDIFEELERRDVSYRAMAYAAGMSNVSVGRAMRRRENHAPV